MSQLKLSVCIATLNRGNLIGETLESIIRQATDEVEVVILDGGSVDNTEQIVRKYQRSFPRLCYFRQQTKMGIDRDFATAVSLARGEYCWLFSDDDILKPGAIQTVLDAIKNDYILIVANSEVRNADLSKLLELKRLPHLRNRIYKSSESQDLLIDTGEYLSFIGCVIIRRQFWDSREKAKYFGSYFVHVGVIFQDALPGDTLVIAEPLVSIRYANATWLDRSFEIWMFKWPALIWSFSDFPDSVKCRVCPREPWRSPWTLLHLRAKGNYTGREYSERLESRLGSRSARMVAKASAHFPARLANFLAFIYYSVIRRPSSRLLVLLDLMNSPFCFWRMPQKAPASLERST